MPSIPNALDINSTNTDTLYEPKTPKSTDSYT